MKKSNNNKSTLTMVVLGVFIVLVAAVWIFLMVGPVYGNISAVKETNRLVKTAEDRENQNPVEDISMEETIAVVRYDDMGGLSESQGEMAESEAIFETEPEDVDSPSITVEEGNDTYLLPESASRFYSKEELEGLDDKQLYLARNEIYARLGRKFKAEELDQYFRGKNWYQPKYEPSAFDQKGDGVFNPYELFNRNLIISIEEERKGR